MTLASTHPGKHAIRRFLGYSHKDTLIAFVGLGGLMLDVHARQSDQLASVSNSTVSSTAGGSFSYCSQQR